MSSLKDKISKNIKIDEPKANDSVTEEVKKDEVSKFVIEKATEKKVIKKKFQMETTVEIYKELEKIKKKTGHSVVGIINMMIKHCLENLEIK